MSKEGYEKFMHFTKGDLGTTLKPNTVAKLQYISILGAEIIKENCDFQYYFNNTDVKPAVLDGGHEIVLANWPNNKHVICSDNNNIPIKIPSHPYVLINRTVLCNCRIEAEDNFLIESIAACPVKQSDLTMHFTVNTAFMHYFDSLTNKLETHETHEPDEVHSSG